VTVQIVADWGVKFNAHGSTARLRDGRHTSAMCAALAVVIESSPIPVVHGVVRWRIVDLRQWIFEEFRIVVSSRP
jgi:hypothetical protein